LLDEGRKDFIFRLRPVFEITAVVGATPLIKFIRTGRNTLSNTARKLIGEIIGRVLTVVNVPYDSS
jgi:hypothetical protein